MIRSQAISNVGDGVDTIVQPVTLYSSPVQSLALCIGLQLIVELAFNMASSVR